jgi:hypothetical protein
MGARLKVPGSAAMGGLRTQRLLAKAFIESSLSVAARLATLR